ncbi:MAG: hypothetical protein JJE04_26060 [Acidobacteriia bacterium]|nr:hypothetical protein [Terriglobia bacterium]
MNANLLAATALVCAAWPAAAQRYSQRGFFETITTLYPQTAPGDSGHAVAEGLLRWEGAYQAAPSLKLQAAFDARTDTHHQVERIARLDWQDRSRQRPALSLRRLSAVWHRGPVTVEAGKQFIRWGKADILNPTDRFAPRDYLNVANSDFLGVMAGRVTYESGSNTVDLVVAPRFTPSRTPLLNQRWVVFPADNQFPLEDAGSRIPGRTQFGARWNHNSTGYEYSLVFYDGFHHLPLIDGRFQPPAIQLERYHPALRLYGGDVAVPLRWFTVKGEGAWFTSRTASTDEYILYVIQLERTVGEWMFTGGYAGEVVTQKRNPFGFAPDRGMARSFLGRAQCTIDARRSLAFEAAVRQTGEGVWLKSEYSHLMGKRWRVTAGFTLIRGEEADFLGQYNRNSFGLLALRYSF